MKVIDGIFTISILNGWISFHSIKRQKVFTKKNKNKKAKGSTSITKIQTEYLSFLKLLRERFNKILTHQNILFTH